MFVLALTLVLALPPVSGVAATPPAAAQAAAPAAVQEQATDAPRPIELQDIMEWNRISGATLSHDGAWLAHRVAPAEGNGEAVVRSTHDATEHRFPIGEVAGGGFGGGSGISISEDSRWVAFAIYPEFRRGGGERGGNGGGGGGDQAVRRNKLGLLDLTSGQMQEFDEVRGFAFSGDNAAWLAMAKYPAGGNGGAPAGSRGGRGAGGAGNGGDERARGADLILLQLATGTQMNIGNVAEFEFDESGEHLAWVIDTASKAGNGVQMRVMSSGVVVPLESSEDSYRSLNWTDEGDGLTVLKGTDNDDYEDPLYSVIGFKDLAAATPTKIAYDPATDDTFPAGMTISSARAPSFSDDLSMLVFGIAEAEMTEEARERAARGESEEDEGEADDEGGRRGGNGNGNGDDAEPDQPELVIWHWKDDRLQSQQQVQENRDRNANHLAVYHVDEGRFVRLADDQLPDVNMAPEQRWAIGNDNDRYELTGNLNGQRFQDIWVVDVNTGDRTMALERARWYNGISPDGSHLLYYEDGHYHTYELATGTHRNITENVDTSFIDTEDDHNIVDPPVRSIGWTADGAHVLLYDNWDIWKVAAHGDDGVNLTVNGRSEQIRYGRRFNIYPDDEGIDLTKDQYLAPYGEWTKKSGIGVIRAGGTGVEMLLWDDVAYGSLMKAEDAEMFAYTRADQDSYPDYWVTDASFGAGERITDANPQQAEFTWSAGARLLDYESDKGDKLQAALFLPADYQPGQRYPTIVYIYERLSQGLNQYTAPSANGFNKSVYTSNGYAVLTPDITYEVNDPGMSAVWSVLPALDAAIETGVVDPDNVGLHGHSWGGYQTSFLVTQTDRFAAAVAGAPLTNMISMYSSIYWNSGGGNMAIFESSQGRFTGDYLEATDAYIRNSPVFFADRVNTPLIILHNDQDGAVDWNQGIEYYNTLRRLGKDVIMLQYVGENHGLRDPANQKDYTVRMREFFDHHLRGAEAPAWLLEGVPHLKMGEHLDERAPLVAPRDRSGDAGGSGAGRDGSRGGRRPGGR
jgi:dipeptidyl aminopeptidase/acylaminoacyl peptidase